MARIPIGSDSRQQYGTQQQQQQRQQSQQGGFLNRCMCSCHNIMCGCYNRAMGVVRSMTFTLSALSDRSPALSTFLMTFKFLALFPIILFLSFNFGMFAVAMMLMSPVLIVALGVSVFVAFSSMNFVLAGRTVWSVVMRLFGPVKQKAAVPLRQAAQSLAQTAGEKAQQAGQSLQEMGQQYQQQQQGSCGASGSHGTQTVSGHS